jgi:hypothetical protein
MSTPPWVWLSAVSRQHRATYRLSAASIQPYGGGEGNGSGGRRKLVCVRPRKKSSAFGPSLRASRGDPVRRLTARVPPCSRSLRMRRPRIAPRFPRPSPAEGPHRFRQCRSGPAGAALSKPDGCLPGRARGAGPGPGGTWFAAGRGPAAGAQRRWGWPSCCQVDPPGAEVQCAARSTHGIVPPGKPHSPSPSGLS